MEEEQRQVLRVWLTVQSNFFVLSARVYWEGVSKELQAILYRDREGHVEVVQCQW